MVAEAVQVGERRYRESVGRYFEDFNVGDIYEHRPGRTISEADNTWFTLLTMNQHPLHFDHEYAKHSEFGKPVVNSALTVSVVAGMSVSDTSQKAIANLGWTDIVMPAPVFNGDTLYAESEVLEKRESKSRPTQGVVSIETRAHNQDCVLIMSYKRTMLIPKRGHGVDDTVRWGTDGVRVFTVDDGWGWIFTAVEHWNAECVGWHVCKRGDRFAALQPISMGLAGLYGSTAAGAARGLALRMDHGSQYLSDHFTNQIKFWGIQPSYAFVAEPQTNGVAERFNRTLKEQIIHGRIYRNIAELRDAVRDFVELYNAQWIVEKNGYLSPAQARQAWHAAISIRPAA